MPQVIPRHLRDLQPLMTIDSRLGGLYIARRPCLNFNKTKHIAIPADQVNFATVTWSPVVPGNHQVAEFPQMEVGVFLASPPSSLVCRSLVGKEGMLGNPIETSDDGAGNGGGQHIALQRMTGEGTRAQENRRFVGLRPKLGMASAPSLAKKNPTQA